MNWGNLLTKVYFSSPRSIQKIALNLYGYWQARQRFGGEFKKVLEELEESQWWAPSELEELQNELLRKMIKHAYENVPYYRRVFNERGLKPADIKTKEDLPKLPFLTREIINEHFDELVARNFPRKEMVLHHTSGTTGQRLKGFYLPKKLRWTINYAHLYRFYRWAGFDVGERRVTIAGRFFTNRPPYWMINWAEKQLLLSTHHLSARTVDVYIERIRKFSPQAIQGHPSAIAYLARRLEELDITIPVKAVLTTGEQLYPDQREIIERRFQCKVFDAWGHGESAGMAAECEKHMGYHIASEYGIIEIIERKELSNELSDGVGEIVATSLHNYAMPFIRYRTGDLGSLAGYNCPCGRGLPLLSKIIGRIDEIITTPEGKVVLPVAFRTSFAKLDFLEEYQFVQEKANEYRMFIVDNGRIGMKEQSKIMEILHYYLGTSANLHLELVTEIPKTPGAKQKLIVNRYRSWVT
ncbi:MAG TPA: phenylacetate--CoA ligase family protein [Desulfobacterales bacterium]|nr:phenylacetate--CoA ligase family protein [Desulfobacterales bacterium]